MKKKFLLIAAAILALVAAYFAGGVPSTAPEDIPESVGVFEENPEERREETDPGETDREEGQEIAGSEGEEPEVPETEPRQALTTDRQEYPEASVHEEQNKGEEDAGEAVTTCSLSVRCDEVLRNRDKLKAGKESVIPEDGILCLEEQAEVHEGESAFDVLYRELRKKNIPFEFEKTPAYNSVYIEGIGNLYEFDCGDHSGWTYRVNGIKPTVGCSQYPVKPGDTIVFSYTCNFLKDR